LQFSKGMMRPLALIVAGCVVIACQDRDPEVRTRNIQSELYNSSGEVALSDGGSLEFSITSESYKQWYRAQQGLDRRIASRFGALLQPSSPSEKTIDRAVEYLRGEPKARDAIERAGMSIREFVVTTVALEQEMRVASERGDRPLDTLAMSTLYPPDSLYPPAYTPYAPAYPPPYPPPAYPPPAYPPSTYPSPAYPTPAPTYPTPYPPGSPTNPAPPAYPVLPERRVDTTRRTDTVYLPQRDTARREPVRGRVDTLWTRRDSILPRRDTLTRRDSIRRDTLLPPRPPRDTLRPDTLTGRP
jgi:hypothetical protein